LSCCQNTRLDTGCRQPRFRHEQVRATDQPSPAGSDVRGSSPPWLSDLLRSHRRHESGASKTSPATTLAEAPGVTSPEALEAVARRSPIRTPARVQGGLTGLDQTARDFSVRRLHEWAVPSPRAYFPSANSLVLGYRDRDGTCGRGCSCDTNASPRLLCAGQPVQISALLLAAG
jgi:hypothetical protein